MYCGICGKYNKEGATYCGECGARLKNNNDINMNDYSKDDINSTNSHNNQDDTKFKIVVCAVSVAIIVALIIIFRTFNIISSPGLVAEKYNKSYYKNDAKGIVRLMNKKHINYFKEKHSMDKDDWDNYISKVQKSLEYHNRYLKDDNIKVYVKGSHVEELDDSRLEILLSQYDYMKIKVSDAKKVLVDLDYDEEGEITQYVSEVVVIKVGQRWYLDAHSMLR